MTQAADADLPHDAPPKLPRGVALRRDEVAQDWLLLAPERVLKPDPVAAEILERCDGVRTRRSRSSTTRGGLRGPARADRGRRRSSAGGPRATSACWIA